MTSTSRFRHYRRLGRTSAQTSADGSETIYRFRFILTLPLECISHSCSYRLSYTGYQHKYLDLTFSWGHSCRDNPPTAYRPFLAAGKEVIIHWPDVSDESPLVPSTKQVDEQTQQILQEQAEWTLTRL